MSDRDRIEPFWAPLGRRLRGPIFRIGPRPAPPTDEKPRHSRREPAPLELEPEGETEVRLEPLPPALPVSTARRRETIAALIADQIAREPLIPPKPELPVGTAAEPDGAPVMTLRGERLLDPAPPAPALLPPRAETAAAAQGVAAPQPSPAAKPAPRHGHWLLLSDEAAAQDRAYGLGGGMILIAIMIVLGIGRSAVELVDFWDTVDRGGLSAWIMAVFRSVMALWSVLLLILMLARSRAFPANFAAFTGVNLVYLALFGLAFAHLTRGEVFKFVAGMIVLNLAAWAYVALSRRTNVTFLRRVRAGKGRRDAGD
ncbi:MAG: hypothetical protein KIT16_19645 [Rhodospirillaceae bacterium]|nr:hypothetical protein [Rhodospirillaceae bacterium]